MKDGERVLVLEDNQERIDRFKSMFSGVTVVTTASECISRLQTLKYTTLFLDHDLNQEAYVDSRREDCGMEVVRFLERLKIRGMFNQALLISIHSHNVNAANAMLLALQRAGYKVSRLPFGFGEFWNRSDE